MLQKQRPLSDADVAVVLVVLFILLSLALPLVRIATAPPRGRRFEPDARRSIR